VLCLDIRDCPSAQAILRAQCLRYGTMCLKNGRSGRVFPTPMSLKWSLAREILGRLCSRQRESTREPGLPSRGRHGPRRVLGETLPRFTSLLKETTSTIRRLSSSHCSPHSIHQPQLCRPFDDCGFRTAVFYCPATLLVATQRSNGRLPSCWRQTRAQRSRFLRPRHPGEPPPSIERTSYPSLTAHKILVRVPTDTAG